MRLRSLAVDQFRRFDRPVRLDNFGPGVNVLFGPNEHGKSTLMAALRAALFEKHRAKGDWIKSYQNRRNGTAPFVSVEFELFGAAHRIEKRFLSRPMARLHSAGARFEDDLAEEQLARLLQSSSAGRVSQAQQAESMWGTLLVEQGGSAMQAAFGAATHATLAGCLEAEIGGATGNAGIDRLLREVQAQLGVLQDGRRQPRDRFKAVLAETQRCGEAIAVLAARRRALSDDLQALETARADLQREADPARIARDAAELLAVRRDREALLGQRDRVRQAESDMRLAELACADIRAARARRATNRDALAQAEAALATLRDTEDAATGRAAAARDVLRNRRAACEDAIAAHDEADRAMRGADAIRRASAFAARAASASAAADRAAAAAVRVAALSALVARLAPDGAALERIRAAVLADTRAAAARDAQATHVTLDLVVPARLRAEDGTLTELAAGPATVSVVQPARLEIPGIGTVRIVPAARDADTLHAAAAAAARDLRRRLDESGCADPAEAEFRAAERAERAAELDRARQTLQLVAPSGEAALRAEAEAETAALAGICAATGSGILPGEDEAVRSLDALRAAEAAARDAMRAAHDALRAPEAEAGLADAIARQAQLDRYGHEAERDRLARAMRDAEAAEPDTDLAGREVEADAVLFDRRRALDALLRAAPDGTPALADAAIARLEQAQQNRQNEIVRLNTRIAGLQAGIAAVQGDGLDENLEVLHRRHEAAAAAAADCQHEVSVLQMMRDTLEEADRAARERYVAPLMNRLAPTLGALFPRIRFGLDENFRIGHLDRDPADAQAGREPGAGEPFDSLSHGTREQVAVLARLAVADMLLQNNRPALLVLDDALTFTDSVRLRRMADILAEAGTRVQILVLTCREDIASALGGTRLRLEEGAAS